MTSVLPRMGWADLPGAVREAVEARTGPVTEAERIEIGEQSEFASVLDTSVGRVFAKGTLIDGRLAARLCTEARINPHVARLSPRLLWRVEAGEWLVLGFEYVPGRHADYSPGSADLVRLGRAVAALQELRCPDHVSRRVEQRWAGLTGQAHMMAGETLIHMDLNPGNVLMTEGRAYFVDWALACKGADWVELALLVPRLIGHGHSPREAEEWAAQFRPWSHVTAKALDVVADAESLKWQKTAADWPFPHIVRTAKAARDWAHWRRLRG
ncbi:phosphotransferase [Streptomyces sp. NA02950]|uniref:phosphotransferase n=1 Tax=Streptomyces sp. NA02950 TaxID=2742137 RepID=UPI0015920517|nr:phosphotransferase [Streptomyces sp. NA02950]QKV94923.1 phosphotransferase [Streptomyces sp. NA02950]